MKKNCQTTKASALVIAVLTLAVVSLIGATVLYNCTTRYNASSKQIKGWNEALYAAEAGSDAAFAEIRHLLSSGSNFSTAFPADSWTVSAAPTPGPAYSKGPITLHSADNRVQQFSVTVDRFATTYGFDCYRIRSVGTSTLQGLRRTGMDDRLMGVSDFSSHFTSASNLRGLGDSLVRKVDFNYDHFLATYGDGDGNAVTVNPLNTPQMSRRIETIAVPQWVQTGAIKVTGSFDGPGSAGVVDSYDSKNGAYTFVANNPGSPLYQYATQGDVSVATSNWDQGGPIYGNVTTNGGDVTHSNSTISGTIDNNVPFTIPPVVKPDTTGYTVTNNATLNLAQPATSASAGTSASNPITYVYNGSVSDLTINGPGVPSGAPNGHVGSPEELYVKIVVNGGVTGNMTIGQGVNAQIYFTGNLSLKAKDQTNNNVDGAAGQYNYDGSASIDYSRAGHLQFFGISPTDGSTQTISIGPPGSLYAAIYAPNANYSMNGNAQLYGSLVCHNFDGNGNTGFHYDLELASLVRYPVDYQIASYIEDIR